jgi:cysteinyl-tRNA synthetase
MIEIIRKLFDKGFAYKAEDGSVYFSIAKFPEYGKLAHINLDGMRPGARVKHDEYAKESVADFALWKAYDEQDGPVAWDSPWGRGRPGWHIECSAMSGKYLGPRFDIHCGGIDNMFPHHEDEIAQSEAANGCRFVNYWLHNAHLIVDGEKMSKSAGNFFTLRDVQQRGYSGREVRWVLLGTHYRQTLNFSFRECDAARAALARVDDFVRRLNEARGQADVGMAPVAERLAQAQAVFRASIEDDLNTSGALGALFDLVRDINRMMDAGQCAGAAAGHVLDQLRDFDKILACLDVDREEAVPADIQALANERQAARKAKDFARADAARNRLLELGWIVEDTPKGPRVKRKP